MSHAPPPLPPDIAEMLALENELDDVSPDLAKSIWGGVEEQITSTPGGGGDGGGSGGHGGGGAPSVPTGGVAKVVSAALTSAVVAGVVGFAIGRASAPETKLATVAPQTIVASDPAAPVPAASAPPEAPSATEPAPSVAATTTATAAARPPAAASDFSAERSLLERARSALARSDGTAAMAAIDEHQRRFPSGSLAEEREALAVRALLASGKRAEAERRAAAFGKRYPNSLFSKMLDADLNGGR
jgi:hypothetical protein